MSYITANGIFETSCEEGEIDYELEFYDVPDKRIIDLFSVLHGEAENG